MSKKKSGIEELLVNAIASGTAEQALTIQKFVNALVNNKVNGTAVAPASKTKKVLKVSAPIVSDGPREAAAAA